MVRLFANANAPEKVSEKEKAEKSRNLSETESWRRPRSCDHGVLLKVYAAIDRTCEPVAFRHQPPNMNMPAH
jgi:hypothetical protein